MTFSETKLILFSQVAYLTKLTVIEGFACGSSGKEPSCQGRRHKRHRFNPWVGKIPWGMAQQLTPEFWPGEPHGQRSLVGYTVHRVAKSQTQMK